MRIVSAASRTLRWTIDSGGAARGRTERAAVVLEVRTDGGVIGLGEAAPLAGLSRDTLEDAARAIAAFTARVPFALADREAAGAMVAASGSASARFAIETALLDALARHHGVSIAALLRTPPGAHVGAVPDAGDAAAPFHDGAGPGAVDGAAPSHVTRPPALASCDPALALAPAVRVGAPHAIALAAVVDDAGAARRAFAAGIRCFKIKLGATDDLARVHAIAEAAPGVRLRIDANRAWPRDEVPARLAALAGLPIDHVEEPCRDAHRLLSAPLACRLALDESLPELSPDELGAALASPSLAAVVVKPALLGGLSAALALAALARQHGVAAIASHLLEGPIGTAACAELALALGGAAPAGLAAHPGLTGWRLAVEQLAPDRVRAARAPGLGFRALDLEAVVNACPSHHDDPGRAP
jgi:L-alanine-DL-glutamate epimerase-like enolase superfamily enzyme